MSNRFRPAAKPASFPSWPLVAGGAALATASLLARRRRYPVRGRIALITGSSRGLGLAIAERFARAGARLVLTARSAEELERARTLLIEREAVAPGDVIALPCDIRNAGEVDALFATVRERWSAVEVLVNNAGVILVGPAENLTLAQYDDVLRTNFYGTLHCTLAALPAMLHAGTGAIVNITSIGGKVAVPHLLPYSASKFACVGFSQGLHAEVRAKGVRVTTVTPGLLRTGSPRNARFTGRAGEEFRWFNLGASLPGVSRDAYAAAGRILAGAERFEAEFSITPQAAVAARLAPLLPGLTVRVLSAVNRLLPSPSSSQAEFRGSFVSGSDLSALTGSGRVAEERWNERLRTGADQ